MWDDILTQRLLYCARLASAATASARQDSLAFTAFRCVFTPVSWPFTAFPRPFTAFRWPSARLLFCCTLPLIFIGIATWTERGCQQTYSRLPTASIAEPAPLLLALDGHCSGMYKVAFRCTACQLPFLHLPQLPFNFLSSTFRHCLPLPIHRLPLPVHLLPSKR